MRLSMANYRKLADLVGIALKAKNKDYKHISLNTVVIVTTLHLNYNRGSFSSVWNEMAAEAMLG